MTVYDEISTVRTSLATRISTLSLPYSNEVRDMDAIKPTVMSEQQCYEVGDGEHTKMEKCKECVNRGPKAMCKQHLDSLCSEYAAFIKQNSNLPHNDKIKLTPEWEKEVSRETNIDAITRCDGQYRIYSVVDGYCAYQALQIILFLNHSSDRKLNIGPDGEMV